MIYKRGNIYWTKFGWEGETYRISLDTANEKQALAREREKIAEAMGGKVLARRDDFSKMTLEQALNQLAANRRLQRASSTVAVDKYQMKRLVEGLGAETPVHRITVDSVIQYRATRHDAGVANATINKEIAMLRAVLKRAKRWHLMADDIKTLKEPISMGRALSQEEKSTLLRVAASKPDWKRAEQAMILALNSMLRSGELRGLRWADVNWTDKTVSVAPRPGDQNAKTNNAARVLPLGNEGMGVLYAIRKESEELFGTLSPDWYVFHWCPATGLPDPARPCKGWRSAWRSILKKAGLSLRFHDLRHHAITELCENADVPLQAIVRRAGWRDGRMLRRYEHIRDAAAERAAVALSGNSKYADIGRQLNQEIDEKRKPA